MIKRKKTRLVKVGNVLIGNNNKISVQSMTNTDTRDYISTIKQIKKLEDASCQMIRLAVPNMDSALVLNKIKKAINIPLIADIHFDYKLALESIKQGVDKIRINPGNIGEKYKIKEVVKACKDKKVPIRIGVNCGSLKALKKNPNPNWSNLQWAKVMVKEALMEVEILEEMDFKDIIVSLKADDIERTIIANKIFSSKTDIPLHIGITEAGTFLSGLVKSSIGLGLLLKEGIGDTIRVSLTEDTVLQVRSAYEILKALDLANYGPNIISCPTCGRTQVDIFKTVHEVENKIFSDKKLREKAEGLKIAVMGCIVNGPGEARDADFGICGGKGQGVWIEKGKQIKVIKEKDWTKEIIKKIKKN